MALRFGGRLFIVLLILLISALPLGTIVMAVACHDASNVNFLDYIASLLIPGYGFVEALICK